MDVAGGVAMKETASGDTPSGGKAAARPTGRQQQRDRQVA